MVSDLISSANPANIESWKNHYFGIRFKFWLTQSVIATFAIIQSFIYTTHFENIENLVVIFCWIAVIVVAINSKKEKTHLVLSIIYFLVGLLVLLDNLGDEYIVAGFWRLPS